MWFLAERPESREERGCNKAYYILQVIADYNNIKINNNTESYYRQPSTSEEEILVYYPFLKNNHLCVFTIHVCFIENSAVIIG